MLNIYPHWISKPCIQKHKNHSKASNGTGKFAQFFCKSHNIMYVIVKLEDTTDIILSGVINQNKNPPQPTFYLMV